MKRVSKLLTGRRWLIRLTVAIITGIASGVGIWTYVDRSAQQGWGHACAEADRLDPGWRWNDLLAALPPMTAEINGVDHVTTAVRLLRGWPKPSGARTSHVVGVSTKLQPQRRLSPIDIAAIEDRLVELTPSVAEIEQIASSPVGRIPLPMSPVLRGKYPQAHESLTVIRELIYPRLLLRAESGDAGGALGDVRLMLTVAGPSADAPTLIQNVIAGADWVVAVQGLERVLAQGEPPTAALAVTRRIVERESARPLLLAAFRGDRAGIDDTLRALDDGRLSRDEVAASGLFSDPVTLTRWKSIDGRLSRVTGAGLRRSKGLAMFRHHTQVIEWLKESPDGLKIHEAEWAAYRSRMTGAAQLHAASFARFAGDARTAVAPMRCAAAVLASEQFRQETGRWPNTLTELVPKYLSAVPRDPCDLQPLRLARRPDGIVIYSVGEDGTDEGGAIASDGAAKATDIGIRLWDVDKRRQPPRP